jgi:hypothetical protein
MKRPDEGQVREGRRTLFHSGGRTYFTKKTERTFFFVLTIIVLLWGIIVKYGIPAG